jgi:hypothetical protein
MQEKSCTWRLPCFTSKRRIRARLRVGALLYIRLIGFTAGTLLMLFWMFFFLCLSLFLFYGGSLLALNAQIYYLQPPPLLTTFAWTVLSAGLCFTPALLLHLHLEYASMRGLLPWKSKPDQSKRLTLTFVYALVVVFAIWAYPKLVPGQDFDFLLPARTFVWLFRSAGAPDGNSDLPKRRRSRRKSSFTILSVPV